MLEEKKFLTPWHEYCEELVRKRLDWEENVPCKVQGPNRMYPSSEAGQSVIADEVCKGCYAQEECLNLALVTKEDYGVWGGATERQRTELRQELSETHNLSNKNIWRNEEVKLAVMVKASKFVERQAKKQHGATL